MDVPLLPTVTTAPGALDLASTARRARGGDSRALDAVAAGFESMFLSLLIKQMRQTLEPGTMFSDDKGDVLGGLFDHFMGQHLAKADSLGIAAMVKQQLAKTTNRDGATGQSGDSAGLSGRAVPAAR